MRLKNEIASLRAHLADLCRAMGYAEPPPVPNSVDATDDPEEGHDDGE